MEEILADGVKDLPKESGNWTGKKKSPDDPGPSCDELLRNLPGNFKCELELSRVIGCGWLSGGANWASRRIAELVDGQNVGVVEKVERVGNHLHL